MWIVHINTINNVLIYIEAIPLNDVGITYHVQV